MPTLDSVIKPCTFSFLQRVVTPRGPGLFIGQLTDGHRCQVAIREDGVQRNPIFYLDQIKPAGAQSQAAAPDLEPETAEQSDTEV